MEDSVQKEIIRLVKEIADDEEKVKCAVQFSLPNKAKECIDTVNRKIEVLKLLRG